MKNIILILSLLSLISCKKIDELTHFTLDVDEQVTIDPIPVIPSVPLSFPIPSIETNSESVFENNNTNKDLVEEARLTKMTLSIHSPDNGNFNFLESVKIYIQAGELDEILMATKTDIPDGLKVMELESTGADLTEYVKEDEISLRIETVIDEITLNEYLIDVHSEFFIDAKILGI
jgi:hypothetical protein